MNRRKNKIQEFPNVPEGVHQAVLDTLQEIGSMSVYEKENDSGKGRRYKKHVILAVAAVMTAVLATTAFATEFFSWHKRAAEIFGSSKELQDKLVEKEIAKDEYASVTDNGLTICAIQTIQDTNCFYALFEVKSEDSAIILDENSEMDVLIQWEGEEELFHALGWGFVGGVEEGYTRMYEIFGIKANKNLEKDLLMNLKFAALRQGGKKAMPGEVAVEGNWEFSLTIHQTEESRFSIEKEFLIAGYPILVHEVVLSPISVTIVCDGEDIKEMEKGEGICLDQLDTLYPMILRAVKNQDGTVMNEEMSQELSEGFREDGNYYKMIRFSSVVEIEKMQALLFGEQMDAVELR